MNNLVIKGESQVCGVTVPNINGGFGADKKAMLAKHIAEIHDKRLAKVNEAINNNRDKFRDNVDVIDMKSNVDFLKKMIEMGIFNKQQIANSRNIYLISESGYRILCNIFEDATISKLLLMEYFESTSGVVIFAEKRKEILFRKEVERVFDGLCTIIPQYCIDKYRVDLYIPELNVVIEFDEKRHEHQLNEDRERQMYIESKLGCKFVRIEEKENYAFAVNKILKAVFGQMGMSKRDHLKLMFKSNTEKSWEMYEDFLDEIFK